MFDPNVARKCPMSTFSASFPRLTLRSLRAARRSWPKSSASFIGVYEEDDICRIRELKRSDRGLLC